MRKINYMTVFIAAAAMTVFGCSKQGTEVQSSCSTHTVTFEVGTITTKTAFSGESIIWSADDATRFAITENGNAGSNIALELGSGNATMRLTATFDASDAPYEYKASMAKNRTGAGHPKIPTTQSSTGSTYDPDADILVAKTISGVASQPSKIDMQFARPAAINKMTLKGLVEGETITSVTVTSDKYITGYYNLGTGSWSSQAKEITISTNQLIPESGEITVYFVTMPVEDASLVVTANSEGYTYSKTFASTISFDMNHVSVFGVNMNKEAKLDYSGTYALTNAAGTKMANAWVSPNYNINGADVISEASNLYYNPDDVNLSEAQVTVTKITEGTYSGMYTIVQNGKYLFAPSSSYNNLQGEDTPSINAYWDITNTAGVWSIIATKSSNRNIMRVTDAGVFACYASSSNNAVALQPIANVKPTPVISADDIPLTSAAVALTSTGATFNSVTDEVTAAKYNDAECTVAGPSWLTVSTSGTGSSSVVNYSVTANDSGDERVAYIKITATNTSSSRSVSKVIAVTQAPEGLVLNFSFTSNPGTGEAAWPTATGGSATTKTYRLNTTDYTFALGANVYMNSGYLMLKYTTYLGLPAISDYKLVKIVATNSSGCSTSTKVGVSSSNTSESYLSGGSKQTWSTRSENYTYNLSSTSANTVYYLYITSANCQIVNVRLTYIPVS